MSGKSESELNKDGDEGHASEDRIFEEALTYSDVAKRDAYLAESCGEDAEMRLAIMRRLKAFDASADQTIAAEGAGRSGKKTPDISPARPIAEGPGSLLGNYKLLQEIGEGGFGVVYMADQQVPVKRRLAIKIIKPGMDTREVVARFEAERQALAMMDHPNIAKVFDAGATDTGRPYFAMELVKGVSITEYCDKQHLNTTERLVLFQSVCAAIQHAHLKGVIHRDLKPSNILVSLHDGVPVVKVIDFGVAKAISQELTEKTLFTAYGQMVGTPVYMSPEQAEMSGLDIDTRSDVYSLGVVLYELLTGKTPLDPQTLRAAGYEKIQQLIEEYEPVKPSTRIGSLDDETATAIGKQHSQTTPDLLRAYRGDLDWIVLKTLERDRNRRYETPSALAGDIERFLKDEPVSATPPSTSYKVGKFVRRNRATVSAVGLIVAALMAGLGIAAWQAVRATKAETVAKDALVVVEKEKEAAEQARQDAEELIGYMLGDLREQLAPIGRLDLMEGIGETVQEYYRKAPPSGEEAMFRQADGLRLLAEISSDQEQIEDAERLNSEALKLLEPLITDGASLSDHQWLTAVKTIEQQARYLSRYIEGQKPDWHAVNSVLAKAGKILEQAKPNPSDGIYQTWLEQSALVTHQQINPFRYVDDQDGMQAAIVQLCRYVAEIEENFEPTPLSTALFFSASICSKHETYEIDASQLPRVFVDENGEALGMSNFESEMIRRFESDPNAQYLLAAILARWDWAGNPLSTPMITVHEMAEKLVKLDATNIKWLRLLKRAVAELQGACSRYGQKDKATYYAERSREVGQELLTLLPNSERDIVAAAHDSHGLAFYLQSAGRRNEAIPLFEAAIEGFERVLASDPSNANIHRALAFSLMRVPRPGDNETKLRDLEQSIIHAKQYVELSKFDYPPWAEVFYAHKQFSDKLREVGESEGALEQARLALATIENAKIASREYYESHPDIKPSFLREEARAHHAIGRSAEAAKKLDVACAHYHQAAEIFFELARDPRLMRLHYSYSEYLKDLALSLQGLIRTRSDDGALNFCWESIWNSISGLKKCVADDRMILSASQAMMDTLILLGQANSVSSGTQWTENHGHYFGKCFEFLLEDVRPGTTLSKKLQIEYLRKFAKYPDLFALAQASSGSASLNELAHRLADAAKDKAEDSIEDAIRDAEILRLCAQIAKHAKETDKVAEYARAGIEEFRSAMKSVSAGSEHETGWLSSLPGQLEQLLGLASIAPDDGAEILKLMVETVTLEFGDGSPELASALIVLGKYLRQEAKQFAESVEVLQEAVGISRKRGDSNHSKLANAIGELAWSQESAKDRESAIKTRLEVIALRTARHGADDVKNLGGGHYHLGRLLRDEKRYDEALKHYEKAFEYRSQSVGADHIDTLRGNRDRAGVLAQLGRKEEAIELLGETLSTWRSLPEGNSPEFARALSTLGDWSRQEGKLEVAESALMESKKAFEEIGDPNWQYLSTLRMLGQTLIAANRWNEAEPILLKAWEGLQKKKSPNRWDPLGAAEALQALAQKKGNAAEAEDWRKKAISFR